VLEWERIRRENPDNVASRVALAQHYLWDGRPDAADEALSEVLRINPAFRAESARGPGGRELDADEVRELGRRLAALRGTVTTLPQ
jgi:hypothetical protein